MFLLLGWDCWGVKLQFSESILGHCFVFLKATITIDSTLVAHPLAAHSWPSCSGAMVHITWSWRFAALTPKVNAPTWDTQASKGRKGWCCRPKAAHLHSHFSPKRARHRRAPGGEKQDILEGFPMVFSVEVLAKMHIWWHTPSHAILQPKARSRPQTCIFPYKLKLFGSWGFSKPRAACSLLQLEASTRSSKDPSAQISLPRLLLRCFN